ncbi:hypothetical protein BRC81_09480 [Halobacteriales archaeon QS_1_68_20]|nr:MAG: hypothetical protein BRC81_09480 [Halobacteriales archaeon QS_1_68_20]
MVDAVTALGLASSGIGALGALLLFAEFFQEPNYLNYDSEFDSYNVEIAPAEVHEYTWLGRTGALLVAVAFALQFFATFLG